MKEFIGASVAGLSLSWSIYQFILKKRDEEFQARQLESRAMFQAIQDKVDRELAGIKMKLEQQEKAYLELRLANVSLLQQTKNQGQVFNDTIYRIEKVLDRHEQKLDTFGQVIIK